MDIVFVLGMLGAFLLGAWVRKPFCPRIKKKELAAAVRDIKNPTDIEYQNLLGYGVKGYTQREIPGE